MKTQTWTCGYCDKPVSEVGGYVKISMSKYAHVACHAESEAEARLAEQERVLTEGFLRRERDLLEQLNAARAVKNESPLVPKDSATTFDTATWDAAATDICALACAHLGPALSLRTLKRYAWFIYTKLRDKKLIQPLSDDNSDKPLTPEQERGKAELEAWLNKKRG